jgi:uncharacterized protein YgbK (DUF1537 family)
MDRIDTNDGRWVAQDIADAADEFFQDTADLLPEEPVLYASRQGDLVAEFKGDHGTMTSIISHTFVLLFAVIDGKSMERRVLAGGDMRAAVLQLVERLHAGEHGALESPK